MVVLRAGVDLHLAEHRPPQWALGQHPLHGAREGFAGVTLVQLFEALGLHAARVTRVVVIKLVVQLVAGDADFAGVEHDDVVTRVE